MEDKKIFRLTDHITRSGNKKEENRMLSKKFLFLLFFVASTISFLGFFRITIQSRSSSSLPPTDPGHRNPCLAINLNAPKHHLRHVSQKLTCDPTLYDEDKFTAKEYLHLSNLISQKSPCNLLLFGVTPQFLSLATLNTNGTTIILEDDEKKINWLIAMETRGVIVHKVMYHEKASNAYELLRHGREHFGCKPETNIPTHHAGCRLALSGLPNEVRERKWDLVVIDGPRGDHEEAPGRMGAIYTAAAIARRGNVTDVLVHDVDRMIEKWYSWEFLCQENLVSSKGKLWHFVVKGNSPSDRFCPEANFQIL